MRSLTISTLPPSAAPCSAVIPVVVSALITAPFCSNTSVASLCPLIAAQCKAVRPLLSAHRFLLLCPVTTYTVRRGYLLPLDEVRVGLQRPVHLRPPTFHPESVSTRPCRHYEPPCAAVYRTALLIVDTSAPFNTLRCLAAIRTRFDSSLRRLEQVSGSLAMCETSGWVFFLSPRKIRRLPPTS